MATKYIVVILIWNVLARKSKCNCPHADGRRVICKHMIALLLQAKYEAANKHIMMLNEVEEALSITQKYVIDSLKRND